jgi:hypothetical protein
MPVNVLDETGVGGVALLLNGFPLLCYWRTVILSPGNLLANQQESDAWHACNADKRPSPGSGRGLGNRSFLLQ